MIQSATTFLIWLGAPKLIQIRAFQLSPELLELPLVSACTLQETGTNGSGFWLHPMRNQYRKLAYQDMCWAALSGSQLSALWVTQDWGDHHILRFLPHLHVIRPDRLWCYPQWGDAGWMSPLGMYAPPIQGPHKTSTEAQRVKTKPSEKFSGVRYCWELHRPSHAELLEHSHQQRLVKPCMREERWS